MKANNIHEWIKKKNVRLLNGPISLSNPDIVFCIDLGRLI